MFAEGTPHIGANGVKVPTYLFKLVYDAATYRTWAHWQKNREGVIAGPPISCQELMGRTGMEFLRGVAVQRWPSEDAFAAIVDFGSVAMTSRYEPGSCQSVINS